MLPARSRPGRNPARPQRPYFSSGPCAKPPGWSPQALDISALGRSHRGAIGKAKLAAAIERTHALLCLPSDYKLGIVPASDTGAMEMALWSLVGPRPVTMLAWESFGAGWVTDVARQLQLKAEIRTAEYGQICDLGGIDPASDVVFTWNGTTSGVRVPNGDWIADDRAGLTICDATSAAFAQDIDWTKIDVGTFSWQKALGGEAAHGMLVLSPRAVERLEREPAPRPLPKIFRLTKSGKLIDGIFRGETINTPSMLCVEDWLFALDWAERIGGLEALIARADANAAALDRWVRSAGWIEHLATDTVIRSNTSVCLQFADRSDAAANQARQKAITRLLEQEEAAFDIGAYRDAPPGFASGAARPSTARMSRRSPRGSTGRGTRARERAGESPDRGQDGPARRCDLPPARHRCRRKARTAPDEFQAIIGDYDGLAVRSSTRVNAAAMDAALPRLKVIGRAGIGVDTIDVPAASARGIVVMNTPFGNSITTAEHAIAMLFALAREIPQADLSTQSGKWEKNRFMGVELSGKTLGLIGCGNIGSIVADRAHGLKMKVAAYDPFLSHERAVELGVDKVELDELLARADFITLHTPLTDQTRGILSREALAKSKAGVRIVNCARGGLIDETALKEALDSGHVAGAALDVFAEEPAMDNALFGTRGLICTPHLGASTTEAQVNVAIQIAEQMADYLLLGGITNAVNVPSLSAEEAPRLKPYMGLAEKLGRLIGQIAGPEIRSIDVEVEGAAAELNIKPITGAVLAGVMRTWSDTVNMVNAPYLAKERGIAVREIRNEDEGDYHTLVAVNIGTEHGTLRVEGSLFGNRAPRLVKIFGIPVEAELTGQMIYIVNTDAPGFIGALGTRLGENRINIATFNLGRREEAGEAIALVAVDDPITPDVARQLHALPGVREVVPLSF